MTYISLHNHTNFSIGAATAKPTEIFAKAKEFNQEALAITDNGSLAGVWDAWKASQKTGVKLIPGCTFNFTDSVKEKTNISVSNLVIVARNAEGYKNILRLSKAGYDNFVVSFRKALPRIDWDLLEQYKEGLICFAGTGNGLVSNAIMEDNYDKAKEEASKLKLIFGDDVALELQPHNMQRRRTNYSYDINQQKLNRQLKKLGEELDIKCVASTNTHYLLKEHHDDHDVLLCIHSGQPKRSGQRVYFDKEDFYFKSEDDVRGYFNRHKTMWGEDFIDSLISNTKYYADRCEVPEYIDPAKSTGFASQLPEFPVKDEPDYEEFLQWKSKKDRFYDEKLADDALFYRFKSLKGLNQKIKEGAIPAEDWEKCQEAMVEEFDVLEYRSFSSYMLITADFLNWARNNNIVIGPGRGSVSGSLTAYCNNIHKVYPFRYGTIFARFLNKFKEAFPDIDSDIAPSGRSRIHEYIRNKYGAEMVANVSNINTVTPKVYARDISRVFELGDEGRKYAVELGNNIADSIPSEIKSAEKAVTDAPLFAEFAKVFPQLGRYAKIIGGQPRAWSTHAGGIVIGKVPLQDIVPLRRDTHGNVVLEYDKDRAEENGLIKIDTLGLETLDIISETYKIIEEVGKIPPPIDFDYEQYDEKTYDLIGRGDTFCVFQLGGTAVHVCKAVKPKSISDIALISALVRPAAKDIINDLIKVRNGDKPMELIHPALKNAFGNTYGYGLFEESLLLLVKDVAAWDLMEADKIRKLTKEKGKNPEKVKQWRQDFINGAINNNFDKEMAERIWDETISSFGGYGFNLAHATAYSLISFQTAYLKANFPLEFLVANLRSQVTSNAKDSKENIIRIKNEIRAMGVSIVPPDLNTSDRTYKIIDDDTVMMGLDALKYMGANAIPELLSKRPFKSFSDLIERTDSTAVRSPSIQALAASGGLESFEFDRRLMFFYASDYRAKLRAHMNKLERKWAKECKAEAKADGVELNSIPEMPEGYEADHIAEFKYPFPKEPTWNVRERFALEQFYMGEGVSGTVFDRYEDFLKKNAYRFTDLPATRPYRKFSDDEKKDRYANRHVIVDMGFRGLKGIISSMFVWTVKNEESSIFGQEMARITLQDPWNNELTLICFPDAWTDAQERVKALGGIDTKIAPGLALHFNGWFQWESAHTNSLILSDIIAYKASPALPEDLKSKKVRMPRAKSTKAKKEELLNLEPDEFIEVLEDIMVENGTTLMEEDDEDDKIDPFGD